MEPKLIKFGIVQVKRSVSWSERLFEIDINSIRYFTSKGELRFEMDINSLSIENDPSNQNILNFIHTESKKLQVKIFSNDHSIINSIYSTFLTYKNKSKTNNHLPSTTPSITIQQTSHIDTIINNTDLILSQCKNWIYLYNIDFILFELSNINNSLPNTNINNNLKQLIISLISSNNINSNLNIISHTLQKTTPFISYRNKAILSFIYFIITFLSLSLSNMFYNTLITIIFTVIYFMLIPFYNKINSTLLTFINQIVVYVRRGALSSQWRVDLDLKELSFMRISSVLRNKTVKELTEMLIVNGEKKEGAQPKVIKNINEDMNMVYWFQGGDVLMRVDVIEKRSVLHLGKDVVMLEIYIALNVENKNEVMDLIWESFRMIKIARYLKD